MLQEKEPDFRGSLEHLGQSTGYLQGAAQSPGKAIGLPLPLCLLHHPRSRSQLQLLPGGVFGPPASLCIPKGTQALFFQSPV